MTDFKVEIRGFRSKEEADTFIRWYESQGEQDIIPFLEEECAKGNIDRERFLVDVNKTFPVQSFGTTRILVIKD